MIPEGRERGGRARGPAMRPVEGSALSLRVRWKPRAGQGQAGDGCNK